MCILHFSLGIAVLLLACLKISKTVAIKWQMLVF